MSLREGLELRGIMVCLTGISTFGKVGERIRPYEAAAGDALLASDINAAKAMDTW